MTARSSLLTTDSYAGPLYRIGRAPDPFAWPPQDIARRLINRYDDPLCRVRTLYAAEDRPCAFVESLARYRTPLDIIARLSAMPSGDPALVDALEDVNGVPADWHLKRRIGSLFARQRQQWLDVREPDTLVTLRSLLASVFAQLGLTDFDSSDTLSRNRRVTQAIAEWAVGEGFAGIVYESRLNRCTCWAIYEGAEFATADISVIRRDDPDLIAAATAVGVRL